MKWSEHDYKDWKEEKDFAYGKFKKSYLSFQSLQSCLDKKTKAYTATLNSLKASFKDTFLSVEGFRLPIIKAQDTWNFPAGNSFS